MASGPPSSGPWSSCCKPWSSHNMVHSPHPLHIPRFWPVQPPKNERWEMPFCMLFQTSINVVLKGSPSQKAENIVLSDWQRLSFSSVMPFFSYFLDFLIVMFSRYQMFTKVKKLVQTSSFMVNSVFWEAIKSGFLPQLQQQKSFFLR
jgi:hypothetical protein